MTTHQREKIAIVGGGMSGLVAAFELSRTQALRDRFEVTVYQLGWRLGGKLASGRDPAQSMRNTEHGLHVWFGFYDNAFAVFRDVFERWDRPAGCPWTNWLDPFLRQQLTPVGETIDGKLGHWDVVWPLNGAVPGTGGVLPGPWGVVTELFNLVVELIRDVLGTDGRALPYEAGPLPDAIEQRYAEAVHDAAAASPQEDERTPVGAGRSRTLEEVIAWVKGWLARIGQGPELAADDNFHGVIYLLKLIKRVVQALLRFRNNVDAHRLINIVDIGVAFLCGMLNPTYQIWRHGGDLDRINYLEFREWLIDNGGARNIVEGWSALSAVYDAFFQYRGGDTACPDYEAGTAARVFIRTVFTYKGAVLYLLTAGMGETVIGPMYEVLRAQGVRFEFFHKLRHVGLAAGTARLDRLEFERQAEVESGPYRPTFVDAGLVCWPSEPFWDQLVDGEKLRAEGVDFESHWDQHRGTPVVLQRGVDFDRVVSAVDLGSFKPLNSVDGSMFAEVLAASPRLARLADALPMVPSVAVQYWMGPTLEGLGWTAGRPAMVTWAYPQDVWADMTAVLQHESWQGPDAPRSLHYFTGVWGAKTDLYARPATAADTPDIALADVTARTDAQFDRYVGTIWPKAVAATGGFDRSLVRSQYMRANVDPAECCVGSPTDTARLRPRAHESGIDGLVLAGNWVRSGINSTCVEQATMTGMAAARAVSGEPIEIVGEYFLAARPGGGVRPRPPARGLPVYVPDRGHGEQVMLPPGQMKRSRLYTFAVPADAAVMTAFARRYLSDPTGGDIEVTAIAPYALCTYLRSDFMTSTSEQIGTISDRECGLWIPLLEKRRGLSLPRLVFWMPYVFIDNSIGMATGREIWGFRKEIGPVTIPAGEQDPARFIAQATIFRTLQTHTRGHVEPLVRVERDVPLGPLERAWQTIEDIGLYFVERLFGAAWRGLGIEFRPSVDTINLKQFRDAADPTRACYQSVVTSPITISRLYAAGPLDGDYWLRITRCESHTIVSDLGLPGEETKVAFGAWLDIDMLAEAGQELWKAKT
jgi:uncharacterized protein with NAD-binding domain and iron-sulfur cluster